MALTVGELNAYLRLDDDSFTRALNASGVRLAAFGAAVDAELARIDLAFAALDPTIVPSIDTAHIHAELDDIERRADELGRLDPTITVHVDSARAVTELRAAAQAERNLGNDRGLSRTASTLSSIGAAAGSAASSLAGAASTAGLIAGALGAALPVAAGLVATLSDIAPAAALGATAVFSLASAFGAIKLGTSGIGGALSAAFGPKSGGGGGGGAANSARQVASAIRAVQDARREAAYANQQAARQVSDAERDVADAQKEAAQAQLDLNDARTQATRDLEDLNDQLADAKLDERDATAEVTKALEDLQAARAQGTGPGDDLDALQLAYDKAVQNLKEAQEQTQRLGDDTAKANKAGVDGQQAMVDARQKIADANRNLGDQERALSDARQQQARTAAQGLENIQKAQEALAAAQQSAGAAGGGVDAFAEAMAKLSPNAQAFVREIIKLKPAFDALKMEVQQRLFAGLAEELDRTAHALLPAVRRSLDQSADSLNGMAKGIAAAARNLATDGTLGRALDGANKGLSNLIPIPGQFVTALTQLAAAASPAFDRLTQAAENGAKKIGDKLSKAFKSGELQKSIDTAVGLIGEIFGVVGNVGKILTNIFAPAVQSGDNFIGVLQNITGQLVAVSGEQGFQDALGAIFSVMGEIGRVVGPLLVTALHDLEPVFSDLGGPATDLVDALGKGLSPILQALGPLLDSAAQILGTVVEAALPLLPVLGGLIAALGPALQPLLDAFVNSLGGLAPLVQEVADDLMLLLGPALEDLPGIVKPLADMIQNQLSIGLQDLTQFLRDNRPEIQQLGQNLSDVAEALIPLLAQWALLDAELLVKAAPVILAVSDAATRLAVVLTDNLSGVINNLVIPTIHVLTDLLHGRFGAAWDEIRTHAGGAIKAILIMLGGMPTAAAQAVAPLAGRLQTQAVNAMNRLTKPISDGVNTAVEWVGGLPGRAGRALGDLGNYLYNSGRALIQGFINGIGSKLGAVGNAVTNVLGFARDHFPFSPAKRGPFSGKGWTKYSGVAIAADFAAGLTSGRDLVGDTASALMGAAQAELAVPGTPMGALVAPPGRGYGGSGGPGAGGVVTAKVTAVLDVRGGADPFTTALRKAISVSGGDVQLVLGTR